MRNLITTFSTILAATAFSISANAASSVWDHNGSQMLLEANGAQRTISYLHPRKGISARPGQIVFQGRRVGNRYQGTAYTFRRGCQPASYQVSGQLGSETRIVLFGASPQRDGCEVIGFSNQSGNSRLVFKYLRKMEPQYNDSRNPPPEDDGPANAPVETIVKQIPGGTLVFKIQDQDAPAHLPIRIDATAHCNNGQKFLVLQNHRTCQFLGIRYVQVRSSYEIDKLDFGNGSCSVSNRHLIESYDLCPR